MSKLVSPEGSAKPGNLGAAPRLGEIKGRKIAFFDNCKPGANVFLNTVANDWLQKGAETRFFRKTLPTGPAPRQALIAVGEWADAAVFAFAD
jgi:hypothetical protein